MTFPVKKYAQKWSKEDDARLLKMRTGDPQMSYSSIGKILGRSEDGVAKRFLRLQSPDGGSRSSARREAALEAHRRKLREMARRHIRRTPEGTMGVLDGLEYKIGAHGKVYYYCDGEWLLSSRAHHEINWLSPRHL